MQVRKGDTISEFLQADLIIPHQHDFYEVIVNKARGKIFSTLICMKMCERLLMQPQKKMSHMLVKLLRVAGTRRTSTLCKKESKWDASEPIMHWQKG
ncbi:unnamed protein product [Lactuca virosa]|uniref:FAM50A/XAP5 C-terminal domain-containing protein n=1 Tax=Lactuca virosa TaxID=75947 RepID=A0AAU9PA39_9ASTR|nr:unnamed protein product [Lactuca virosa]